MYACASVCVFVCVSVGVSVCMSVCLCVCLFVCLAACLSVTDLFRSQNTSNRSIQIKLAVLILILMHGILKITPRRDISYGKKYLIVHEIKIND